MKPDVVKYDDATAVETAPAADADIKRKTLHIGDEGFKVVDAERGILEALVSVSNNTDSDGERFRPGAWKKWLRRRRPKGVHAHAWSQPTARCMEAEELMPGDDRLPSKFIKAGWGALRILGQYNLATQRGREAFSDIVFFGKDAEFSVGFRTHAWTDAAEDEQKEDPKFLHGWIEEAELYEWSDVLFGANPDTQILALKGARSDVVDWMAEMARKSGLKDADIDRAVLESRADDLIVRIATKGATTVEKCQTCSAELGEGSTKALQDSDNPELAPHCGPCVEKMAEYAAAVIDAKNDGAPVITINLNGADPSPELTEKLAAALAEEVERRRDARGIQTISDDTTPCAACATKEGELVVLDGAGFCESCTKIMREAADVATKQVAFPVNALAELNA